MKPQERGKAVIEQEQYRMFRRDILEQLAKRRADRRWMSRRSAHDDEVGFGVGRAAIMEFRGEVAERALDLSAQSSELDQLVRRALRLASSLPLVPDRWANAERRLFVFLPFSLCMRRARRLLRLVGTPQGRELIFEHHAKRTLSWSSIYYGESLDFALRWFEPVKTWRQFESWGMTSINALRTARLLGLTTVGEVRSAFGHGAQKQKSELALLLVAEGVIRSVSELPWAGAKSWSDHRDVEAEELRKLRAIVRLLLAEGVERRQIASILRFPLSHMNPALLGENIATLKAGCVGDMAAVLERLGDRLWRTPTPVWRFVLDVIGARSVERLGRFRRLLDCHHELSAELARVLVDVGAGLDELEGCQRLFVALDPERADASKFTLNLRQLASSPYLLRLDQLAQCEAYLTGGSSGRPEYALSNFLEVLSKHGLDDPSAVLEFQSCFENRISASCLDQALKLQATAECNEPLDQRVAWVLQAARGAHLHVFEYLVQALQLRGVQSLQQVLKLAPLGIPFLRCLIEDRGLDTLRSLKKWYYQALGVEGYQSSGRYDAVDKLLFNDAFQRNHFGLLESNQAAVMSIVRRKTEQVLGAWPWKADEEQKTVYRKASDVLTRQTRFDMLPVFELVLDRTGGVILEGLFDEDRSTDQPSALEEKLARLTPLLDDLLAGCGPTDANVSPMEVGAIALVYRTSPDFIQSSWRQVRGLTHHLDRLTLRKSYDMSWRCTRRQLQGQLERSGFFALVKAAEFSSGFAANEYRDMFTACQRLSPKQLREHSRSASVETLARHMGSLLALAGEDSTVSQWTHGGFGQLLTMDDASLAAYQRIGDLVDLFNVVLPDALGAHADHFIDQLSDVDAEHWATRLGPSVQGLSGRALLRAMVTRTREKALPVYLRWARRQLARYQDEGDATRSAIRLEAKVSKHPAAFFAKKAANLCSAGRMKMWEEERQTHLLVFDPLGRRLVGMAMLYVQVIPQIDPQRPSLVIRAINPIEEVFSAFETRSIVDSFFSAAQQIAEDNRLACVAFPALSGAHLMSNRSLIEDDIKQRYVGHATSRLDVAQTNQKLSPKALQRIETKFYAYEHGEEAVDALYVVWRPDETNDQPPLSGRDVDAGTGVAASGSKSHMQVDDARSVAHLF